MADSTPRTPTQIDTLAEEWLDTLLDLIPELHIHLGRPGSESDYADRSPDGAAAAVEAAKAMLARVRTAVPADEVDAVTQAELVRTLSLDVEKYDAGFWQRDLNVIASPGQDLRDIFDLMSTDTGGRLGAHRAAASQRSRRDVGLPRLAARWHRGRQRAGHPPGA